MVGSRAIGDILASDGVVILDNGREQRVAGEYIRYSAANAHLFEQAEGYVTASEGATALAPIYVKGWRTYNFEVEDLHTYIAGGVRVHNQSVFTSSGADLTIGVRTNASGERVRVNEDGSLTNLDTGHVTAGDKYAGGKYTSVVQVSIDLKHNVSPSEQYELASQGAFAHYQVTGSGPMVQLASGAQVEAGTMFSTGNGYLNYVNSDGSITNLNTGHTTGNTYNIKTVTLNHRDGKPADINQGRPADIRNVSEAAHKAFMEGKSSYTLSNGMLMPTTDINGNERYSYADEFNFGDGSLDYSPVILDLDGDGIEITPLSSSTVFLDVVGDGKQHRTAWGGVGDGVLVRDAGNDGVISAANEVDFTQWDPTAKTDMQALLAVFDTNGNGKLDSGDIDWSLFKVMVTKPDGTTELKTLGDLGIASIDLVSNNQEVTLSDGSRIVGTANYTRTDGSTGTAADARLTADMAGYVVSQSAPVVDPSDGSTTVTTTVANPDGSLASTISVNTSLSGVRTTSFDDDGDGVVDRVEVDETAVNPDGSTTRTVSVFDDAAKTILLRAETTTTSAGGDRSVVGRDLNGSGSIEERETRDKDGAGNLTVTVEQLSEDGTTLHEVSTTTSADGLLKTTETRLSIDGTLDATRVQSTSVDVVGTRTETVSNYAGNATTTGHLVNQTVTVTTADGMDRTVSSNLDGLGGFDLVTHSTMERALNGDTTTTIERRNGDNSVRDAVVVERSADGYHEVTKSDADGVNGFDRIVSEDNDVDPVTGETTRTTVTESGDSTLLSKTVETWSADGTERTTATDRDGDTHDDLFDEVSVDIVTSQSVRETRSYSRDGTTLQSRSVTTTQAGGLHQTTEIDSDGQNGFDSKVERTTATNLDGSATIETIVTNGDGTVQIGKTVTTVSADGLQQNVKTYVGAATTPQSEVHSARSELSGAITETVYTYAGNDHVEGGHTITVVSADRLQTTIQSFEGTNISPHEVTTIVEAPDGTQTQTTESYSPDGLVYLGKTVIETGPDGLSITTTSYSKANVLESTRESLKEFKDDGTVEVTDTLYAGDGTAPGNRLSSSKATTDANGLGTTVLTDANGDGVSDARTVSTTTLNADGSTTNTVVTNNGSGTLQTGKSITTVSDDGLTKTSSMYYGAESTADRATTDVTVLNADGSTVRTVTTRSADNAVRVQEVTSASGDGRVVEVATDLDGDGHDDRVVTRTVNSDGSIETLTVTKNAAGAVTSQSLATTDAHGLTLSVDSSVTGVSGSERTTSDTVVLNADGSKTETVVQHNGTTLESRVVQTSTADGLSVTTQWDGEGTGTSFSHTQVSVTTLNDDGSVTKTATNNYGDDEHDEIVATTTSAKGRETITTRDLGADTSVDQTIVQRVLDDGSMHVSSMAGAVTWAGERGRGATHSRYDVTSADGLSSLAQFDSNGDGLAESEIADTTTLLSSGGSVRTITSYDLSGGLATDEAPSYARTATSQAVITTNTQGNSVTTQWDLDSAGGFDRSQTDVTTIDTNGAKIETTSNFGGATLESRVQVEASADGLTTVTRVDATGAGSYAEVATATTIYNADGSVSGVVENRDGGGTLTSRTATTTSADGRSITTLRDVDGDSNPDERIETSTVSYADPHVRLSRRAGWHPHLHVTVACLTDDFEALRAGSLLLLDAISPCWGRLDTARAWSGRRPPSWTTERTDTPRIITAAP